MYLKSLELQGFKSFPDRLTIRFHEGITAIVGPNGSGKSNIADAIRWVLGEQSTKALRGGRMEDVIFAGTQTRRQVGYAEVSLTLDNSARFLNTEYDEVTVTRRFYRSGESEFSLNRKPAKLKDIHELFMDTGLGRDGYSIIGQGKIDEILSVRSEERREVFDEAAGITKYRYRKEEAERRLAAAEENLARTRDILAELEAQLGPLRAQAEKERKYIELGGELKKLEVSVWLGELEDCRGNLAGVAESCRQAGEELDECRALVDRLYAEGTGLAGQAAAMEQELEQAREKLQREKDALQALDGEIGLRRAAVGRNREELSRMEAERGDYEGRRNAVREQMEKRRAALEELAARQAEQDARLSELARERDAVLDGRTQLAQAAAKLREDEQQSRGALSDALVRLSAAQASADELDKSLSGLDEDEQTRKAELASADERLDALRKTEEDCRREAEESRNRAAGFAHKLSARAEKTAKLRDGAAALSLSAGDLDNRIRLLSELANDYEGFSRSVRTVMRAAEGGLLSGVHAPVSELLHVEERFVAAAGAALGGAIQNIVVDREEDAKAAIQLLKSRNAGRATFLPLTAIRGSELAAGGFSGERGYVGILSRLISCEERYAEIFRNLLGKTVVFEDMDAAIAAARRHRFGFRIVTLDGQIINAGGSMTGGSSGQNTGVLSRINELARLREKKKENEAELGAARAALAEAERAETALRAQLQAAEDELRDAENALVRAQAEAAQQAVLCSHFRAALENRDARRAELLERRQAVRSELEKLGALRDGARAEAERLAAAQTELSGKIEEKLREEAGAAARISALKDEAAGLNASRQAAEAALDELGARLSSVEEDYRRREELLKEYGEKNSALGAEIAEMLRKKAECEAVCADCAASLDDAQRRKLSLESRRVKNERAVKENNERLVRLEREKARLDARRDALQAQEDQLTARLWDTYELTCSTAEAVRVPTGPATPGRIEELRRFIRALGSIASGSIQEYERVRERYTFLSAQQRDAEDSQKSLESVIRELTGQMREVFAAQFDVINRAFGETFAEIFGGGQARVELDDPDDLLGSGIEIKVQLPGKSLKVISLLSGGEKAFVAIALYFAILKVRPAPFCVLDEIEAALDDVNVTRYARYLRRLSEKTQFIVITHRRGTMEEADMLYGVAMPVQGVSKVLSLNVASMEKELQLG